MKTTLMALLCTLVGGLSDPKTALVDIPEDISLPVIASSREERFPSREERLKVYMSNWYRPWPKLRVHVALDFVAPDNQSVALLEMESAVVPDTAFYIDPSTILDCLRPEGQGDPAFEDRVQFRKNMNMYCTDVARSVLTAVYHVDWEGFTNETVPTILQFGDLKHSHDFGNVNIPHIKKFRSATTPESLEKVTSLECVDSPRHVLDTVHDTNYFQPIVWKLASRRHFGNLEKVYREDTPWESKENMAVFRGQLTGSRDGFNKHLSDEENCMNLRRCRLVYTHADSDLIQARNRLPATLNGVDLMAPAVTIRRLLAFKGIIMLEGNDVASGLKWALLSQSVVLMPIPKHTSWALEELLEPWVHYIPLNENATDVEEKMQWVLDNDRLTRRISERASLWMEDMVFHPDSAEDDRWIQEEIIRRYRRHYVRR